MHIQLRLVQNLPQRRCNLKVAAFHTQTDLNSICSQIKVCTKQVSIHKHFARFFLIEIFPAWAEVSCLRRQKSASICKLKK